MPNEGSRRNAMNDGTCKFHSSASALRSRRGFLAGSAAVIGAGMLPAGWGGGRQEKLIDTHHHFYPPEYQKLWLDWEDARKSPHFPGQVAWSKGKAIEDMDKAASGVGKIQHG